MTNIRVTTVGKVAAHTGLEPATPHYFLNYVAEHGQALHVLIPTSTNPGNLDDLFFALIHACLTSPEFGNQGYKATRSLPWQLNTFMPNEFAERCANILADSPWHANLTAANGSLITVQWANGIPMDILEGLCNARQGALRDMFRNVCWVMSGVADVLEATTSRIVPDGARHPAFQGNQALVDQLSVLPRMMRRLAHRVAEGVPDDVLWMTEIEGSRNQPLLSRREILALRKLGLITPEQAMEGSEDKDKIRVHAFAYGQPTPQARANWFRDACRDWKKNKRAEIADWHKRRAAKCAHKKCVEDYYDSFGNAFETAFERALVAVGINFEKMDTKGTTGAADYLIKVDDLQPIVCELKTKENGKLVTYNNAVEVLAAAIVHKHPDKFCITVCHPGVDPAVPTAVADCGKLCVLETADLGEALLRLCEGKLAREKFYQWLTTPGQALISDLPFA